MRQPPDPCRMSTTPDIPFARLSGVTLAQASGGSSRASVALQPEHLNSQGMAHGGLAFTLADTCMGAALRSLLEPTQTCVTVETKISYFRAGVGTTMKSESEVVHKGRSLASMQCRVFVDGTLIAAATSTFAIRAKAGS